MDTLLNLIKKHQSLKLVSKDCKVIFNYRNNEFILECGGATWMGEWLKNIDTIQLCYKYKFYEETCNSIGDAKQSKLLHVPGPHRIDDGTCANHSWIFERNIFQADDLVYYTFDTK